MELVRISGTGLYNEMMKVRKPDRHRKTEGKRKKKKEEERRHYQNALTRCLGKRGQLKWMKKQRNVHNGRVCSSDQTFAVLNLILKLQFKQFCLWLLFSHQHFSCSLVHFFCFSYIIIIIIPFVLTLIFAAPSATLNFSRFLMLSIHQYLRIPCARFPSSFLPLKHDFLYAVAPFAVWNRGGVAVNVTASRLEDLWRGFALGRNFLEQTGGEVNQAPRNRHLGFP